MRERESLSRLLTNHSGVVDAPVGTSPSSRLLDDRSLALILDASLGVIAALRALTDAAEKVILDRHSRVVERLTPEAEPLSVHRPVVRKTKSTTDRHHPETRQRIPLSY